MSSKTCKLICDWSTNRGTLFEDHCTLSVISRYLLNGFFLITHISRSPRISYKPWNSGCHRSVIKCTLLEEQCISASTEQIFLKIHTSYFPCMRYKRWRFGSDGLLIKGTPIRRRRTFLAVSPLPLVGFSWKFIYRILHACATCCYRTIIKGILLCLLCCISAPIGGIFLKIIQGVPGGRDKTSVECSLCWTIPI